MSKGYDPNRVNLRHEHWALNEPQKTQETSDIKISKTISSPPMFASLNILMMLCVVFPVASAEIYRCLDQDGKTIYSDTQCSDNPEDIQTLTPEINVAPFEDRLNPSPTTATVLYSGSRVGRKTRFVSVSIYEETDTYMIFEIEGYYNGPSNSKAEFRVMPNIHWRARSFESSTQGLNKGYARVELGSQEEDIATSDMITLQLWQYSKGKSSTVIETINLPFKKVWIKEQ